MAIDLLNRISQELGFQYELYLVPDGNFGSLKSNGEWNGMIGEVLKGVRNLQNYLNYSPAVFKCNLYRGNNISFQQMNT